MSAFRRMLVAGAVVSLLSIAGAQAQTSPPTPAAAANPNNTGPRPGGRIPDAKVRGNIRPVDTSAFPPRAHSEFVAGPNSGFDSAWLVLTRVPAGASGPPLHTHPADQFYFVLKGQMNAQLGDETFTAGPNTLVMIPEGTPHRTFNTGKEEEWHLELIVPPPPSENLVKPAEPRHVENAAGLVRKAKVQGPDGRSIEWLARRASGSPRFGLNYSENQPGKGGPGTHIHSFDQVYFVIEGTLTVQLGLKTFEAGPNTFVIIPAGTVHRQWNAGDKLERHVGMIFGEPPAGQRLDVPVVIEGQEAAARRMGAPAAE